MNVKIYRGPFNIEEHGIDKHAEAGGVTTQGVAVRGGIKKHHN